MVSNMAIIFNLKLNLCEVFLFYVGSNDTIYRTTLLSSSPFATLAILNATVSADHPHLCAATCYKNDNTTIQQFLAFQNAADEISFLRSQFSIRSLTTFDITDGLNNASTWVESTESLYSCSPNPTSWVPLGCKCSPADSTWIQTGRAGPAVIFTFYDPHANASNSLILATFNETKQGFDCGLL